MLQSAFTIGDLAVSTAFFVLKHEPSRDPMRLLNPWMRPKDVVVVLGLKWVDKQRWAFVLVSGYIGWVEVGVLDPLRDV